MVSCSVRMIHRASGFRRLSARYLNQEQSTASPVQAEVTYVSMPRLRSVGGMMSGLTGIPNGAGDQSRRWFILTARSMQCSHGSWMRRSAGPALATRATSALVRAAGWAFVASRRLMRSAFGQGHDRHEPFPPRLPGADNVNDRSLGRCACHARTTAGHS